VKVTLGSVSDLRFSQGVCPKAVNVPPNPSRAPERVRRKMVRIIMKASIVIPRATIPKGSK
jgi:hypothetical protein